jgi:hypothetical protein
VLSHAAHLVLGIGIYSVSTVAVARISMSQPDPVCAANDCCHAADGSCHCGDSTGVSFSQPTQLDDLLVCTQLMGTPGSSQVRSTNIMN